MFILFSKAASTHSSVRNFTEEVRENVREYFSKTTVHGFRYVVEGRNSFERFAWILFIFVSIVYSVWTVLVAWQHWDTHPVETTIDRIGVPVHELPFPAITVCDTDSLKMPRRNQWMFLETLLNSMELTNPEQLFDGMSPSKCYRYREFIP